MIERVRSNYAEIFSYWTNFFKKTLCQCAKKTIGKTISNVLNILGVVLGVSHHSLTHILSTLPSSTTYEPNWMFPSFSPAYFYKACVRGHTFKG
jgi:hypothetical protein